MPLRLCSRDRAPSYSKEDYPYIQRGFIMPNFNLYDAIDTYFLPNNETANVYTQLAGLLTFMYLFLTVALVPETLLINNKEYSNTSHEEIVVRKWFYQFALFCIVACMFASLITHSCQARNRRWHDFLAVCDWGGSLVIAFGTCVAVDLGADFTQIIEHHVSWKSLQSVLIWSTGPQHLVVVIITLVGTLIYLGMASTSNSSHAMRFIVIGVAIILTTLPGIFLCFWLHPIKSFIGLVSIFSGGFFFASHYPEKKYQNTFDICCPSHALWHLGYEFALVLTFDTMAILFFGQSPFTADNFARSAKFLIENFMIVLV